MLHFANEDCIKVVHADKQECLHCMMFNGILQEAGKHEFPPAFPVATLFWWAVCSTWQESMFLHER